LLMSFGFRCRTFNLGQLVLIFVIFFKLFHFKLIYYVALNIIVSFFRIIAFRNIKDHIGLSFMMEIFLWGVRFFIEIYLVFPQLWLFLFQIVNRLFLEVLVWSWIHTWGFFGNVSTSSFLPNFLRSRLFCLFSIICFLFFSLNTFLDWSFNRGSLLRRIRRGLCNWWGFSLAKKCVDWVVWSIIIFLNECYLFHLALYFPLQI
jgi:hypothetical protein